MESTTPPNLITTAEARQILYVSQPTLSRMVKAGTIKPAFRLPGVNGAHLFNRADVERLAAERQVTA